MLKRPKNKPSKRDLRRKCVSKVTNFNTPALALVAPPSTWAKFPSPIGYKPATQPDTKQHNVTQQHKTQPSHKQKNWPTGPKRQHIDKQVGNHIWPHVRIRCATPPRTNMTTTTPDTSCQQHQKLNISLLAAPVDEHFHFHKIDCLSTLKFSSTPVKSATCT